MTDEMAKQMSENNANLLGILSAPVAKAGPMHFVHGCLLDEWLMFDPDPAYKPDWSAD